MLRLGGARCALESRSPVHLAGSVSLATSRPARAAAARLVCAVYRRMGFLPAGGVDDGEAPPDDPHLRTLVYEEAGDVVGTISVALDSPRGLPCEAVFAAETKALRGEGARLFEATRFAVEAGGGPGDARVAEALMLAALSVGRERHGGTDLLAEVNPRHVGYYRLVWRCRRLGPVRPCPRVAGAPAVLLRMPGTVVDEHIAAARRAGAVAPLVGLDATRRTRTWTG